MANVLIVDNSPSARRAISSMLMQADLAVNEILEAGDGVESLAVLSSGKTVNLIFSNIAIPDMESAEFIKTIRTKRRFVPILLATAEGNEEIMGNLSTAGAIDFIRMPCTPAQLQEKVVGLACELKCIYCGNCKQ
jgi:two-component system, chemotaxis family, chemotaxis protein CheY